MGARRRISWPLLSVTVNLSDLYAKDNGLTASVVMKVRPVNIFLSMMNDVVWLLAGYAKHILLAFQLNINTL